MLSHLKKFVDELKSIDIRHLLKKKKTGGCTEINELMYCKSQYVKKSKEKTPSDITHQNEHTFSFQ